jgi:hypothetical protein
MHGVPSERLRAAIIEDLSMQPQATTRDLVARAVALTLGSPEFQRY